MKQKAVIFLGDGMADEPIEAIGGKTPLQHARTPWMDRIAREGRSGTLFTLPQGFPTSSDAANMSVLGCDLPTEYCGRGPLEAAGRGIVLGPEDIAFRLNLVTRDGACLLDHSGGHIAQEVSESLIAALQDHFGGETVRFHAGVSYRNMLVLSGPEFSSDVKTEKPDENHGNPFAEHRPVAATPVAQATVDFLIRLMDEAPALLAAHPVNRRLRAEGHAEANGVWAWSGGKAGAIRTLEQRYGISGAVISAVDVVRGLGTCLGMEVIDVPGATGYIDTNYEGKADAAIAALDRHDFVYVHIESTDEVSHEQDLEKKIMAIEDFDARLIGRVLQAIDDSVTAAVLPDHPVPISIGIHTRTPVPVSVRKVGLSPDNVTEYNEITCPTGTLGDLEKDGLMRIVCDA